MKFKQTFSPYNLHHTPSQNAGPNAEAQTLIALNRPCLSSFLRDSAIMKHVIPHCYVQGRFLALLLLIRLFSSSNFKPKTGCVDWSFMWSSSFSRSKRHAASQYSSPFTNHSIIRCYTQLLKKVLNQKYLRRPTAFYGRRSYLNCMDDKFCTVSTVSWIWHVTKIKRSEDSYLVSEFHMVKAKVKCTLVQALRLCRGRTAHTGSRGIAPHFLDHDTRRGWGVSVTPRPLSIPGKDPVPIVQEAGWFPRPIWIDAENLAPHQDSIPGRLACNQSLYRISYQVHEFHMTIHNFLSLPLSLKEWYKYQE